MCRRLLPAILIKLELPFPVETLHNVVQQLHFFYKTAANNVASKNFAWFLELSFSNIIYEVINFCFSNQYFQPCSREVACREIVLCENIYLWVYSLVLISSPCYKYVTMKVKVANQRIHFYFEPQNSSLSNKTNYWIVGNLLLSWLRID